jgi:tRNA(Ile)-lysidine synthase
MPPRPPTADDWSGRWRPLARAAAIDPGEKLLLALSGGADSVLLLHCLAAARPRPEVRAVHVDHGLRGAESDGDARFCAELCAQLGVPLVVRRIQLDARAGDLEARAREARYAILAEEARASGHLTLLTGHHGDDVLETLLQRWVRGSELAGLRGPRALRELVEAGKTSVRVVRPLLGFRREEVRALLKARGLDWREDSSNRDERFTRTRTRHGLLPLLEELGGPGVREDMRGFSEAVESLEGELARATAHLAWAPAPHAAVTRGEEQRALGGTLARGALAALARPLRRRVLWRLLSEGIGASPSRTVLEKVLADLDRARCTRHSVGRGWILQLRAKELVLVPPSAERRAAAAASAQLWLPFPSDGPARLSAPCVHLAVPGSVTLADGRRITAELCRAEPGTPAPREPRAVELDARDLAVPLTVRWAEPGDRFRGLGAPGSKPLGRFLRDRGVPREERARVALVSAGKEILWVAGIEPSESRKVERDSLVRLRLALIG